MMKEYNYHTEIMGCSFDMTFIAESTIQADSYFMQAVNIARLYENKFSRFDPNSELSFVNKNKSAKVSLEFLEVYEIAFELYEKSQKRFNPLMQVARIGYDKSFEKITNTEMDNTDYNIDLNEVTILKDRFILQDLQNLDFGGFLKGYVAQKITQKIKSSGGIIINIGGDMYVRGRDQNDEKFIIEIIHPMDVSKNILVAVENESLCTSGTYKRKWNNKGNIKHHILSTQTKDSAKTDVISASIIHKEAAVADAYATLAITLGSQNAKQFFDKQQIKFVIICENGSILRSNKF